MRSRRTPRADRRPSVISPTDASGNELRRLSTIVVWPSFNALGPFPTGHNRKLRVTQAEVEMAAKICHRRFEGVARPYRVSPRRHRQRQYSEGLRPVARLVLRLPRRRRQGARRDIGPLDLRDYLETAKARSEERRVGKE